MTEPRYAPAGSWASPITSRAIVAASVRLSQPQAIGDHVYWLEGRPEEKGRVVLVRAGVYGRAEDLTPQPFSVRSKAHEYGGGAWVSIGDDAVAFVNAADQAIYVCRAGECDPLTAPSDCCYADLLHDPQRERLIAVSEDHGANGEAVTTLVAIALADGRIDTLASGADFYSTPALDSGGRRLAWLTWSHPDMPWDETALHVADVRADGTLGPTRRLGRPGHSLFQPTWGPDERLYYAADYSDWWNLYCHDGVEETRVTDEAADYALGQWIFGMRTFAHIDEKTLIAMAVRDGEWSLRRADPANGEVVRLEDFPFTDCEHLAGTGGRAAVLAGAPDRALCVVEVTVEERRARWRVLRRASELTLDADVISIAQPLSYESGDGEAHAFYYPPRNPDFALAEGEAPPLLVKCHGGPTAATSTALDPRIQYWTSRGFAVVDVNYRGSTGYGRRYRQSLYGNWGVADVDDCVNAVHALVERGLADRKRCVISGSSAGGYTVLCALTFRDVFAAGASYYGIGDLALLTDDTHKFESRYTDRLVGPWPEAESLYRERSPLHHADGIRCPVIFFQGLDDKVVPPNQATAMVEALREGGVPVAYVPFEGEGHGFRQADNIRHALDAELAFYGRVLGFTPAGDMPALHIDNLD